MAVIAKRATRIGVVTASVAVAAALVLSGCSATSSSPTKDSGEKSLTVWFPGNNETEINLVEKKIVPAFEKKTGAKVQVTYVDWGDISTKLNSAFAAGTAPDVFGHGPAAAADFVANGRLSSLDSHVKGLSAADRKDLAAALPGGRVDGKQYLMPLSNQGSLIMYDAAAFTASGLDPDKPPTTWPALLTAAKKLTERDSSGQITRSGLLLPSQDIGRQQTFATLLAGAGGSQLNASGTKILWDSAAGTKALSYFASLYDEKDGVSASLGQDYSNAPVNQQPILLGTAAMAMMSSTSMEQVVASGTEKDLRVMPPLSFPGNKPAALEGAGPGLMINSDSDEQSLAWKFISYFIDSKVNSEYTQGIGAIPLRASAAQTSAVKNDPILQAFLKAAPNGTSNPNVPSWVQVRDIVDKHLEQALHGTVPAKEALQQAATEALPVLKANG